MKGLILKDLYQLRRYWKFYGLIALFSYFGALCANNNNAFFLFYYPALFMGMIPVSLLSMDEQSQWDQFSCGLPYTRRQIVSAKFLVGLLVQGAVVVMTGGVAALQLARSGSLTFGAWGSMMLMMVVLPIAGGSLVFPWVFKLGVEKGRLVYMLGIGVVCGLSVIAKDLLTLPHFAMWVLPIAAVGIYALSFQLSVHFYEQRELG